MRSRLLASALCLAFAFGLSGCDDDDDPGANAFRATLSGANEVPPTSTSAGGTTTLSIDGTSVTYRVEVQSIVDVTAGHIHSGAAGVNGPVRVTLVATPVAGATNGVLAEGSFTASDVSGISYDDLLNEIRNGTAYVNVHTAVNPTGEIRGQIVSAGS